MQIIEFDAARPGLIDGAYAVLTAAHEADQPELPVQTRRFFTTMFTHPWPGRAKAWFAAVEDGRVLGFAALAFWTDSNPELVNLGLTVAPDRRREGIGSALFDHAVAHARAQGRTTVNASASLNWDGGPERHEAGARFLERRGFDRALTVVNRRSLVDGIEPDREQRLYTDALAAAGDDYELHRWAGPVPDERIVSMARMDAMIVAEIPLGDLAVEPEPSDPDKIRAAEAVYEVEGRIPVNAVAVHRASGEIVAWSQITVDDGPYVASHQGITIVDPDHRGHRLGLLTKLANLRQLRERFGHVKEVWTDNADVNEHMIAINRTMGYETIDAGGIYQRKFAA